MPSEYVEEITEETPEDQWEVVEEETPTRMIFDKVGDRFIGTYLGMQIIDSPNGEGETFEYVLFRGMDKELYSTSAGYKFKKAFGEIIEGSLVRITYIKDVDMGTGRNPMKDFRVEVKTR